MIQLHISEEQHLQRIRWEWGSPSFRQSHKNARASLIVASTVTDTFSSFLAPGLALSHRQYLLVVAHCYMGGKGGGVKGAQGSQG